MAWDLTRFDWRTFRLDRLAEPRATGAHAIPRQLPVEDAAEFVRSGIDSLPSRYQVEVLIDAPAAVVRDRIGPWGASRMWPRAVPVPDDLGLTGLADVGLGHVPLSSRYRRTCDC